MLIDLCFQFPNFLFYGPPGTGKTSTILAAARELFGYFQGSNSDPIDLTLSILCYWFKARADQDESAGAQFIRRTWYQRDSRESQNFLPIHSSWKTIRVSTNLQFTVLSTCSSKSCFSAVYSGKPCPPFKIVILDEADSMTSSAQVWSIYKELTIERIVTCPLSKAALRRTMEKESKTTRFCLICNYISRFLK